MNAQSEYWREAVMDAFEGCGLWDAVKDIPMAKLEEVGAELAVSAENQSLAFYTPENPVNRENQTLERRLKWQRELEHCAPCNGTGRLRYNAGPWGIDTSCSKCHGAGKVHPRAEREPVA